jgi:hypothetical protein|tara:strand:- start:348 stop:623 length:276 start_codon:yes stop_codon:yes gene_type:complete
MLKILKQSKPLGELKEGDNIYIQGKEMKVDKHYLLQSHGNTKEMIIEVYNPENDKEYQVRYFDDQVGTSIEVYYLEGEFQYIRKEPKDISW